MQVFNPTKVAQIAHYQTGATANGSTVLPYDDTIPQSTEGFEFMTLAFTPKSATNKLYIDVAFYGAASASTNLIVALFQDAVASALAARSTLTSANIPTFVAFRHEMIAGTAASTTFKIRAGTAAGNAVTFNGASLARLLGGVGISSITITEVTP